MDDIPQRKRNRLSDDLYRVPGAYFITICTWNRACLFSNNDLPVTLQSVPLSGLGRIAEEEITSVFGGYGSQLRVEKYVVMPNHIHLLLVMEGSTGHACPDVRYVVRYYKRRVTQRAGRCIWQKGFHDHIIRNDSGYHEIWKYIDENPIKWAQDRYYANDAESD